MNIQNVLVARMRSALLVNAISQAAIVLYFVFFAKSGFSFFYVCPLPKEHN